MDIGHVILQNGHKVANGQVLDPAAHIQRARESPHYCVAPGAGHGQGVSLFFGGARVVSSDHGEQQADV